MCLILKFCLRTSEGRLFCGMLLDYFFYILNKQENPQKHKICSKLYLCIEKPNIFILRSVIPISPRPWKVFVYVEKVNIVSIE